MPGNPRLRLPQYFAQVGDAQLALGEEGKDAQSRRLSGGLESAVDGLKGKVKRSYNHIKIYLYDYEPVGKRM
jgi:hypothetical protein